MVGPLYSHCPWEADSEHSAAVPGSLGQVTRHLSWGSFETFTVMEKRFSVVTRMPRSCREASRDSLGSGKTPRGSSCLGLYGKLSGPLFLHPHPQKLPCQRAQESMTSSPRPRFICSIAMQTTGHNSCGRQGEAWTYSWVSLLLKGLSSQECGAKGQDHS